jgi:hypothetical protein
MESTNQRPAYLINMRGIRFFSNQVENFPIWMEGDNFVLIGIKMNAGTRTQANRLRRRLRLRLQLRKRNHNRIKSIVSRPGDTIIIVHMFDNFSYELRTQLVIMIKSLIVDSIR